MKIARKLNSTEEARWFHLEVVNIGTIRNISWWVPVVAHWVKNPTVGHCIGIVQFLAWCSRLKIWHCHSCSIGCSWSLDSILGPGTSICWGCGHKKTFKNISLVNVQNKRNVRITDSTDIKIIMIKHLCQHFQQFRWNRQLFERHKLPKLAREEIENIYCF